MTAEKKAVSQGGRRKQKKTNKGIPTSHCLRQMSMFLRCAFEKWSHAFCRVAAVKTAVICSTLGWTGRRKRKRREGQDKTSRLCSVVALTEARTADRGETVDMHRPQAAGHEGLSCWRNSLLQNWSLWHHLLKSTSRKVYALFVFIKWFFFPLGCFISVQTASIDVPHCYQGLRWNATIFQKAIRKTNQNQPQLPSCKISNITLLDSNLYFWTPDSVSRWWQDDCTWSKVLL